MRDQRSNPANIQNKTHFCPEEIRNRKTKVIPKKRQHRNKAVFATKLIYEYFTLCMSKDSSKPGLDMQYGFCLTVVQIPTGYREFDRAKTDENKHAALSTVSNDGRLSTTTEWAICPFSKRPIICKTQCDKFSDASVRGVAQDVPRVPTAWVDAACGVQRHNATMPPFMTHRC